MAGSVDFRLLGQVEAIRDGRPIPLGGPRQKALLALLLLDPGRPVAAAHLIEELWPGEPAGAAATTLRSYVSRLRHALDGEPTVERTDGGYLLDASPEHVDAVRFQRLVRAGDESLARGAAQRAAEHLAEGLSLWRGRPFGPVALEGSLRLEADRLEELRLHALELRIDADLQVGRSAELVDELEVLVEQHPYRERLWRQLMLALYRSGRQADALEAYRGATTILDEELGLEPGEELMRLQRAILRHEVPDAQPPEERHNLPAPLTAFIGRETEVAELRVLVDQERLVTLTGAGGAGKTRLALELARQVVPDFPQGVVFVDLAPLAIPELVPAHVARALDLREQPDQSALDQLAAHLRSAEVLLVLDNCEHLLEACAELAHTLLTACPGLRVVATSRQPLEVAGELDYRVDPLGLPSPEAVDPELLLASDAVRLFMERARAARLRLTSDGDTLEIAARICRDLDGLPLAIELAAARAKSLPLDEIAARLSDRFRFLVSWRRLTPARHRTLREAVDWSYQLLSPNEQALLSQLSVFSGGFTTRAVADAFLAADEDRALELIERLVAASFVVMDELATGSRFRMLETIRQFAAEQLEARGDTADALARHARYFAAMLDKERHVLLTHFDEWVAHVTPELDNLRAALARSREASEVDRLVLLVKELWRFWWVRGDLREGLSWLEAARACATTTDASWQGELLEGSAGLSWAQGDLSATETYAVQAREHFASAQDDRGEEACLILLGHVSMARGDFERAESLFERARELAERLEDKWVPAAHIAVSTHNLGSVALGQGDIDRAVGRFEEAASRYHRLGDQYGVALSELYLAIAHVEAGRMDDGTSHLTRALPLLRAMGFGQYAAQCLDAVAAVVHARGDALEGARLVGAASAIRERVGDAPSAVARLRERETAALRRELGEAGLQAADAEGRRMAEHEALDRAERALLG